MRLLLTRIRVLRSAPGGGPGGASGIAMVELLVLVAVLGVVGLAALDSTRSVLLTQRRDGAARRVLAEIRATQSLAVTRHGVFGLHWAGDPDLGGNPAAYRIVRDASGACNYPPANQSEDGTEVVAGWFDLGREYPGVRIESIRDADGNLLGGVMFDTKGESVNTCTAASFPVRVAVADVDGRTRIIEISAAGSTGMP
jgi:type II secretory pathway pseudopilin PulG